MNLVRPLNPIMLWFRLELHGSFGIKIGYPIFTNICQAKKHSVNYSCYQININ